MALFHDQPVPSHLYIIRNPAFGKLFRLRHNGFTITTNSLDKKKEKNERKIKIKTIKEKIRKLKGEKKYSEDKLRNFISEITKLKASYMTEKKFYKANSNKKDEFNYGREVIKTSLDARNVLPYQKFKLYSVEGGHTTSMHYFNLAGHFNGAILKGGIRVTKLKSFDEFERNFKEKKGDKNDSRYDFSIFEP
ncbi:MAG: hypothetical protein Q9N26_03125, partial [Aquificota bacterium]|nr:hypothetical protein [Aquificota bacterium]